MKKQVGDMPINLETVVPKSNLAFINEKIIKYCGDDQECKTIMDTDIIRVWMTERRGYFEVKLGDTWAEVRENIQRCHGLLTYRFLEHGKVCREALDLLSYEEQEDIPVNLYTVVSKLHLAFINEKIIKYCGDDVECKTIMDTGIIRVWLPEREGYFRVHIGDTWAKVRENLHCC